MEGIDLQKIDKKVWLVKVPTALAEHWRPIIDRSLNNSNLDDDLDAAGELGSISFETGQEKGQHDVTLTVAGIQEGVAKVSMKYKMNKIPPGDGVLMHAFSYKAPDKEGANEELAQARAEGTVDHQFSLQPEVDDKYRNLARQRNIQANTKTRQVKLHEDTRENRMETKAAFKLSHDIRRKTEAKRQMRLDQKRTRKDKGDLEEDLFSLFEQQEHWTLMQLVKETNQPGQFLKEVLAEIAIMGKAGPLKDLYSLKPEFKDTSKEARRDSMQL